MNLEQFVEAYKTLISNELEKSTCEERDLEYHYLRFYAFRLAEGINDLSQKELAENILWGYFPQLHSMDDLGEHLQELYECYDEEDHQMILDDLKGEIKTEYFGN